MKVAIHQPHYLPWLRYAAKLMLADVFVLLDDVQYTKNGWQNRNRIKHATGWMYLTVPVSAHHGDRICDVAIAGDRWRGQHWRSLQSAYARSPYFRDHRAFFEDLYGRRWERLADLTRAVVTYVRDCLRPSTVLVEASSLGVEGRGSERLVRICQRLGATEYLSGVYAAQNRLDAHAFRGSGVEVRVLEWTCPPYRQGHPAAGFIPDLSVVDLLFNEGPHSGEVLGSGVRVASAV